MDETVKPDGLAQGYAGEVIEAPLSIEMRRSYLDYAMSVIVGRALPDARDGLKPVHRRVMHSMNELGTGWNKPYKKSARVVGDTIGKYHPHGDSAVYETIVRMAQDFSLRYPLVDGQGNFGSVDGDAPAAMRYTEVRLAKIAEQMLEDIDKDTVDFGPNYDGSESEPLVLPTRFPNLLVNGSTGIAVGMATNIPPHNLREIGAACIAVLKDPNLTVDDLIKLVPAPDFPTGGIIWGVSGAIEAFRTGKGSVTMRSKTHFEEQDSGRWLIVVDELPYLVNKKTLQEKIAELVNGKELDGISNIQDESDKSGMRLVIELKRGENPEVILNNLFKKTQMETVFPINMIALADGQPKLLDLKAAVVIFVDHRREVVFRRTSYELRRARERGHVLEGFAVALSNLEEVIILIKGSAGGAAAKEGLMGRAWPAGLVEAMLKASPSAASALSVQESAAGKGLREDGYWLSERQAHEILQLRLQQLTSMEKSKIFDEYAAVLAAIEDYSDILAKRSRIDAIVAKELEDVIEEFGDERKSQIEYSATAMEDEDLIPQREMVVTLSKVGYIKTQALADYAAQKRGGRGKSISGLREDDRIIRVFGAHSHDRLLCFTSKGRVYSTKVFALPEGGSGSKGRPANNVFNNLGEGEKIINMAVAPKDGSGFVVFASKKGICKKTAIEDYRNAKLQGLIGVGLDENDELAGAALSAEGEDVMLFTKMGRAARFEEQELRVLSRSARGVMGMRLMPEDEIISVVSLRPENRLILTATELGYAKRTSAMDYRRCARGSVGVKAMELNEKTGGLLKAIVVKEGDDLAAITRGGVMIRVGSEEVRATSRTAQGVRVLRLPEAERLADIQAVTRELAEAAPMEDADALAIMEGSTEVSEENANNQGNDGAEINHG